MIILLGDKKWVSEQLDVNGQRGTNGTGGRLHEGAPSLLIDCAAGSDAVIQVSL